MSDHACNTNGTSGTEYDIVKGLVIEYDTYHCSVCGACTLRKKVN